MQKRTVPAFTALKGVSIALLACAAIVAVIVLQGIRTGAEVQKVLENANLLSIEVFGMGADGEGIRESLTIENTSAASDLRLLIDGHVRANSIFRASTDERTRTYYDRYTIELSNGRIVIPRFATGKAQLVVNAGGGKRIAYSITGIDELKAYIDQFVVSQGVVMNDEPYR